MRGLCWILVFVVLGSAETLAAPQERQAAEIALSVTTVTESVEFGKAFPLTVVRAWDKGLEPDDFRPESLAPLVLKPIDVTRREDDLRVEETLRYSGYAFSRGEVEVPAVSFRAMPRDAGEERIAFSDAFTLRVASALDADDSGRAELPGGPFPAPVPWPRWVGFGAAALAMLSLLMWFFRRRTHRPPPPPPRLAPHQLAAQRLAQLREQEPEGFEATRSFHVETAEVLREYLEGRFGLIRAGMTTEELFSDDRAMQQVPGREMLSELFSQFDLAKFARHLPSRDERSRLLTAVETFVAETSPR